MEFGSNVVVISIEETVGVDLLLISDDIVAVTLLIIILDELVVIDDV